MAIIITLCTALGVYVAFFLSSAVTKPIRSLVRSMGDAGKGDFSVRLNYEKQDEFGYLIENFNAMLARIEKLIDDLYVSELYKRRAELKALQAQINPHFLYNTLDSIT